MTASDDGKAFLQVCLGKRLLDKTQAKEIWQAALESGATPQRILIERGMMAAHTVAALEKELKRVQEPRTIGGYRLVKPLGQGGMATVFLAQQVSLGREVALKLMSPQIAADPAATERFLREARIAATVNHPNVIGIIDVGQADGQLYMALELVTGGDAAQLAERFGGALPEARALELLIDCAQGLQALYEARLVHRDLKPSNIFITGEGTAKLGDLGLARSEDGADRMTVTGHLVGTPAFMSPEQAGGDGAVDIRSDLYALGATLFALVTGRQPFVGNSPIAVAAKALTEPAPDPRTLAPHLSAATAALILRAMAKQAAERFQTPRELREALEQALAHAPQGGPRMAAHNSGTVRPGQPPTPVTLVGRRAPAARAATRRRAVRQPWVMLAVVVLATVVLVTVLFTQGRPVVSADGVGEPPATSAAGKSADRPVAAAPAGAPVAAAPAGRPGPEAPSATTADDSPAPGAVKEPTPPAGVVAAPPPGADPPRVPWAAGQGRDAFGHWLTVAVAGAQQRFRWMPPGTCVVGAPPGEPGFNPENEAQSTVTFTYGVWLADSECTQAFWQAVTGSNPSAGPQRPDHPVNRVSIAEAIAFSRSLRPRLGGARVRLPSRAEWERACRAGSTTAYHTGDDVRSLQGHANLFDLTRAAGVHQGRHVPITDGFIDLAPVRSFAPNRWGFYDMHGNVSEYCLGLWYSLPPVCSDPLTDDDPAGQQGFIRGGAFDTEGSHVCRSAAHPYIGRDSHNPDIGLRLLIEAPR